jgi:hypothetical protein
VRAFGYAQFRHRSARRRGGAVTVHDGCGPGDKLRFYKALPTLRHIVLVYQDQMRVEHYRKTDMGWELESLTQPDEFLRFEAVTFEIMLEHVYFGVELNTIRRLSAR